MQTSDSRLHVSIICTGNICRSPIGEHVLRAAIAEAGLSEQVRVSSAGTGSWHVGQGANPPAAKVLADHGYPHDHVAQQITAEKLDRIDLALAADRGHLHDLLQLRPDPTGERVMLLRSFDPTSDGASDVPDPYGRDEAEFVRVLKMIEAAVPGVVAEISRRLQSRSSSPADAPFEPTP
ncbi:low molecular weight phosphotyrosine protein phosphatase [Nakamurella antarctica]|uniref:protein-tyrosine-phosphatase n=1 Tax=Nakamurella antarctica TaxID=1902245 RepID=A0A3G8ZRI5_9ACTN|nr:low molecular weight phosphotyrosine protein phosphatase [Nakamurella antarctica]